MFTNVKEAVAEKIEVIDLIEEQASRKSQALKPWMLAPVAVLALGTTTFFVIRRFSKKSGK